MKLLAVLLILSSCNLVKTITGGDSNPGDTFFDRDGGEDHNDNSDELNITYPEQRRTIYIDDETNIRTMIYHLLQVVSLQ